MADEVLWFDHATDATGSPLQIGPGTNYPITEASFPAPEQQIQWASSVDTEGELDVSRRYTNRIITLRIEMAESGANDTLLNALQQKFAKLQREGGTFRRTRKDGTTIRIYDVLTANGWEPAYDFKYVLGNVAEVVMQLPAKPLARGAEVDLGDNVETTNPCLIVTEASVPGDVPALGRLVIDNDASVDQRWLTWGIETDRDYTFTDSTGSGGLFYQAESRTPLGGAATAAGPTGASGSGSNVIRNAALTTTYQATLSTQASGAGAHLSHIGTLRVYARVQVPTTNTGEVSVALEWGEGDFRRFQQNATTALDPLWEGTWRLVDLGLVNPGSTRWEGRILARSTVLGDDIDIDWLMLVPAISGSGVVSALTRVPAPTAYSSRDSFDQSAGALTGKTAPVGGVWAGAGDADDFQVSGSGAVTRAVGSDAGEINGRFVTLPPSLSNTAVQVSVSHAAPRGSMLTGVVARWVNTTNYLLATLAQPGGKDVLQVRKRTTALGATFPVLASAQITPAGMTGTPNTIAGAVRLEVDQGGNFTATFVPTTAGANTVRVTGQDPDLAAGGSLATGAAGIYEAYASSGAAARTYDDFFAYAYAHDAAVFASQSLELLHDRVTREDSSGTLWVAPSVYIGDYLRVPPSGAEGRQVRVIVKASRNAPGAGPDSGIDDISAVLSVTPRYLG